MFQRRHGDTADIHTLEVGTGRVRRLTSTPEHEFSPAWSPHGRRIAWVRTGGSGGIRATSVEGGQTVALTTDPGDDAPDWR